MARRYGKFADLKAQRVVDNWPTLTRWIREYGFPAPFRPTPGTTLFDLDEVEAWLESRRSKTPERAA